MRSAVAARVYSIKTGTSLGRSRAYWETDDLYTGSKWRREFGPEPVSPRLIHAMNAPSHVELPSFSSPPERVSTIRIHVGLWQTDPAPWTGADAADPLLVLPNGSRYDFKPQLYNLDGIACASACLRHSLARSILCKSHLALSLSFRTCWR